MLAGVKEDWFDFGSVTLFAFIDAKTLSVLSEACAHRHSKI